MHRRESDGSFGGGVMTRSLRPTAIFLLAAFTVGAMPATAQTPYGYWATAEGADGVKLGVIYPSFSPNDFAGVSMMCTPGTSTVLVSIDSPKPMRKGAKATVALIVDGQRAEYRGTVEISEMDDQTRLTFTTTEGDPIFAALGGAKAIAFGIDRSTHPLPVGGARESVTKFLARCRGGDE
jgi:hypothetical protein